MRDLSLLYAIASRNGGIVSTIDCRRAGFTYADVASKCRSGEWSRLARGAYLVAADASDGPNRAESVRAAVASFGQDAVVGLQTAADLHGIGGASPSTWIHLILPASVGRARRILDPAIKPHQFALRDEDVTVLSGIRVTTAARTLMDLVCCLDRFGAVAVADSSLNRGLVSEADIAALSVRLAGRRGSVVGRQALAEADGRAESPLETRVRLRAADGKVAPDQLQYVVRRSDGSVLARCDFAWTGSRLIGEADGVDPHTTPEALFHDRERQNALLAMGFRIVRFTWPDTLTPNRIPEMVRAARAGADRS